MTMRAIPADCPKLPVLPPHVDGLCDWDSKPLPRRRTRWCSDRCASALWRAIDREHDWNAARAAALERDGHRCVMCGSNGVPPRDEIAALKALRAALMPAIRALPDYSLDALYRRYQLEVNHIVPRVGAGYGIGCHNHLDNLETLCHPCHVKVTNQQRAERGRAEFERQQKMFETSPPLSLDEIHAIIAQVPA